MANLDGVYLTKYAKVQRYTAKTTASKAREIIEELRKRNLAFPPIIDDTIEGLEKIVESVKIKHT